MLRFIDLTGQVLADDTEPLFAFFNTVPDCFIEIDGEQTWSRWEEFERALLTGTAFKGVDGTPEQRQAVLARFQSLFPLPWPQKEQSSPPTLSDLSQSLLYRTHKMHQSICEFEGMFPPPYGECVMEWVDAVAAMDKGLFFFGSSNDSGEAAPV